VWQTQRYFEKVELVKKREHDLKLPPLSYEGWLASKSSQESLESSKLDTNNENATNERSYRLVTLQGTFQHSNQVLIGPRGPPPGALAASGPNSGRGGGGGMSSSMQGYWVLTPFVVSNCVGDSVNDCNNKSDGTTTNRGWFGLFGSKGQSEKTEPNLSSNKLEIIVWINRGWIPRHFVSNDLKIMQHWDQPQGLVEIMTMESETEKAGRFSPPSRLEAKSQQHVDDTSDRVPKLLWLDRQAIAELTDCPPGHHPPLFAQIKDATDFNTFPARSTREFVGEFKVTPEVHAGYATTWFGLSGAGVLMTRKLLSRGR
jgi:surfeit locus 1 family protein